MPIFCWLLPLHFLIDTCEIFMTNYTRKYHQKKTVSGQLMVTTSRNFIAQRIFMKEKRFVFFLRIDMLLTNRGFTLEK